MAQNREKDETLDLQVPAESPISGNPPGCAGSTGPADPARIDLGCSEKAEPCTSRGAASRSGKVRQREEDQAVEAAAEDLRTAVAAAAAAEVVVVRKAVNRCCGCGKRVGLTGFRCRCGDLYCSEHRYSDRHDCSFDYKAAGREAIARENPVVRAAKILKV